MFLTGSSSNCHAHQLQTSVCSTSSAGVLSRTTCSHLHDEPLVRRFQYRRHRNASIFKKQRLSQSSGLTRPPIYLEDSLQLHHALPKVGMLNTVEVLVEKAPNNSRRVFAGIDIAAPSDVVWEALTNYEGLGNFIPGLAENKCLERRNNGARLLQVGAQDIALGMKFCARVILDIYEFFQGIPADLCSRSAASFDESKFPHPRTGCSSTASQDIAFSMIEGDFQVFRGMWRLQSGCNGDPTTTRLSYSLFVRPQIWLPVQLIQSRIEREVANNLLAVQKYTEKKFRNQNGNQNGTQSGQQ